MYNFPWVRKKKKILLDGDRSSYGDITEYVAQNM